LNRVKGAPAGLPPWLRNHTPINFSSISLCLAFFFQVFVPFAISAQRVSLECLLITIA